MSTLKEMAAEYREAAAKLAMAIEAHKKAGDLSAEELTQLQTTLHDVRAVAHLLAGYYGRIPAAGAVHSDRPASEENTR